MQVYMYQPVAAVYVVDYTVHSQPQDVNLFTESKTLEQCVLMIHPDGLVDFVMIVLFILLPGLGNGVIYCK